ncbi:MAG: anti-sigma factor [Cycloclasticus sp.]|nr:MAG: anti-sigma factor [Cycloclasticus sp.]
MSQMQWTELQNAPSTELFPGIRIRTLMEDELGVRAMLVEIDPGACWQGGDDVHESSSEEVYIVSGVFNDGIRDYPAGTYIHMPKGSAHVPQSKTGCTVFVYYPDGRPL